MDEITDTQWSAVYAKVLIRFQAANRQTILNHAQHDEWNNLRLMVNAYNAGTRTQNLYSKMKAAVE